LRTSAPAAAVELPSSLISIIGDKHGQIFYRLAAGRAGNRVGHRLHLFPPLSVGDKWRGGDVNLSCECFSGLRVLALDTYSSFRGGGGSILDRRRQAFTPAMLQILPHRQWWTEIRVRDVSSLPFRRNLFCSLERPCLGMASGSAMPMRPRGFPSQRSYQ
jgi:hypothetical protein